MTNHTILVPIDFSESSRDAYLYACHLAMNTRAKILLLHVYDGMASSVEPIIMQPIPSAGEIMENKIKEFLATMPHEEPSIPSIPTEIKLAIGLASNEIMQISEERSDIQKIVMGSRTHYGVKDRLFGTISTYIAKNAKKMVYLIPQGCRYQKPENLLVASDIYLASYKKMEEVILIARQYHPCQLHFVHVKTPKEDQYGSVEKTIRKHLESRLEADIPFEIKDQIAPSVWEGIRKYLNRHRIDLVIVIPHNPGFWEKFVGTSKSSQIAMRINKPVLSLGA